VGLDHLDVEPAKRKFFTDLWYVADIARDEAGDRREIFVLKLKAEKMFDLVDLCRAKDVVISIRRFDYLDDLFGLRILIFDLTDDLLEDIFNADQAGYSAVFIDHDGDLRVIKLKYLQQFVGRLCLRHEKRRTHYLRDGHLVHSFCPDMQQVADIDNAFDIVDRVAINW